MNTHTLSKVIAEIERKKGPGKATDLVVHGYLHSRSLGAWPASWGNVITDWLVRPWGARSPSLDVLMAKAETEGIIRRDPNAAEPAWTAKTAFSREKRELTQRVEDVQPRRMPSHSNAVMEIMERIIIDQVASSILAGAAAGSVEHRAAAMAVASLNMPAHERKSWREGDAVTLAEKEMDVNASPGDLLRIADGCGEDALDLETADGKHVGQAWVSNLRRAPLGPGVTCRITKGPHADKLVTLKAQVDVGGSLAWETDLCYVYSHEVVRVLPHAVPF